MWSTCCWYTQPDTQFYSWMYGFEIDWISRFTVSCKVMKLTSAAQKQSSSKERRKTLQVLQPAASGDGSLVGSGGVIRHEVQWTDIWNIWTINTELKLHEFNKYCRFKSIFIAFRSQRRKRQQLLRDQVKWRRIPLVIVQVPLHKQNLQTPMWAKLVQPARYFNNCYSFIYVHCSFPVSGVKGNSVSHLNCSVRGGRWGNPCETMFNLCTSFEYMTGFQYKLEYC